jgi:Bacterial pre-peptidase C-terminal domain
MNSRFNLQLKRAVASGFAASLLCLPALVGAAAEVEPNDTQATAQGLVIASDGSASVTASLGAAGEASTTDIDIYAFDAKAGDVPTISLNANGGFDAILYFYDSVGNLLDSNDDAYPPTEGSACIADPTVACDPRIDLQPIGADGRYYIAVGPAMRFMWTNFEVHPSFLDPQPGGAYALSLQGISSLNTDTGGAGDEGDMGDGGGDGGDGGDGGEVSDAGGTVGADIGDDNVLPVMITTLYKHHKKGKKGKKHKKHDDDYDTELGAYDGKKKIPVAIHSMGEFNAVEDVDISSLTFGATGDEDSLLKCKKKGKRVYLDGIKDQEKDLVCYFRPDRANIVEGDMSATLKGRTKDGQEIAGSGILRVFRLPTEKTLNWYERHDIDPRAVKPKKAKKSKKGKKGKKYKKARKDK